MNIKQLFLVGLLTAFVITPLLADSHDGSVSDVVASHEELSGFNDIVSRLDSEAVDDEESIALFAPHDDALADVDVDDLSDGEVADLFDGHSTVGLASTTPLEFVEWFGTNAGERVTVEQMDDAIYLNGTVEVIETIKVSNGFIHVISDVL